MVEVMDAVHRALNKDEWCYLASFAKAGAFGDAPYGLSMLELSRMEVDVDARSAIRNWLRLRTFQVELAPRGGRPYSKHYSIMKAEPEGGVLSPMMWLACFYQITETLEAAKKRQHATQKEREDAIREDDATAIIVAETVGQAKHAAK